MMNELKVRDAMVKKIITIRPDATIAEASKMMAAKRVGSLIVMKGGNPIGILTESDLVKKVLARDIKASSANVQSIMSAPLVTARPDDDLTECMRRMIRNGIRRMPVVESGKLVGILTHTDTVATSPNLIDFLSERVKMRDDETVRITEKETSGICEVCDNYSEKLKNTGDRWVCEDCIEGTTEPED